MHYIVLYLSMVDLVSGSAHSECTSAPPKYLNFAAGTVAPMLIVISSLQKCLKNLPILITNYIPFEKCLNMNPQFLFDLLVYIFTIDSIIIHARTTRTRVYAFVVRSRGLRMLR
jgi:hypothetical protein